MDPINKINLIQNKTEGSGQVGMVMTLVRKVSLWALVALIASGLAVGVLYYFVRIRDEQLAVKQQQLSDGIAQNSVKEGLVVSVKQRVALTKKIIDVQRPVSMVLDTITAFVSPGQILNVSLNDKNIVSLRIQVQSIGDVISMTDALVKLNGTNRVQAPQLVSLSLGGEEGIDLGLSFVAVF